MGHLAVQIAKAYGAHVIGTASVAKHAFLRELGADEVIDYTTVDVPATVRDVDIVIQMFGGEAGLRALECLRPGGVLVCGQGAWTPGLHERAGELGVHDHVVYLDVSEVLDAVGDSTEKRRHIFLLTSLWVGLGEVAHGPGDSLGHVPAFL